MFIDDSHCHIGGFDANKLHTLKQTLIIPSIKLTDAKYLAELRNSNKNIKIGFGIHPWEITNTDNIDHFTYTLEELIQTHKPDLIGECGLDYLKPNHELQKKYLCIHLMLAKKYQLPIILHCVKSYSELISLIKKYKIDRGIVHAFNSSYEIAKELTKHNIYLGVGNIITKTNNKLINLIPKIPIDKILIESDAPFMPINGQKYSNSNNTFLYAQIIAKKLNINLIELITINNNNLKILFK